MRDEMKVSGKPTRHELSQFYEPSDLLFYTLETDGVGSLV